MTGQSHIAETLDALAAIPNRTDAAVVLRHAEREVIPAGTFGADVPLTTNGVVSAFEFGKALGLGRQVNVTSSPVQRCVKTAEAILQGCGNDSPVQLDSTLGDPGPFVVDPEAAGPMFLNTDALDIVRRQLSDSVPLDGMRPTADGVRMLLRLVVKGLDSSGRLNVFVTHDAILAVFVATLFGKSIEHVGWPDYLDALLIWGSYPGLNVVWRGVNKISDPLCGY